MSNYVSVAELPTINELHIAHDENQSLSANLAWEFTVPPHVDQERIVLNTGYLNRLHKVGAMYGSGVVAYEGDQSYSVPTVSGINADGSAIAGRAVERHKAEDHKTKYQDPSNRFIDDELGHTFLLHRLNKPELAAKVISIKERSEKSDTEIWAKVIDNVLRNSMRDGSKEHLAKRSHMGWRAFMYYFTPATLGSFAIEPTEGMSQMSMATYMLFHGMTIAKSGVMGRLLEQPRPPIRWSIFPSDTQLDRYAVVNAMSRQPGLVTTLK